MGPGLALPGLLSARDAPSLGRQPLTQQVRQHQAPSPHLGRFYQQTLQKLAMGQEAHSPSWSKRCSGEDASCPSGRTVRQDCTVTARCHPTPTLCCAFVLIKGSLDTVWFSSTYMVPSHSKK
jgi:hypothetical protein